MDANGWISVWERLPEAAGHSDVSDQVLACAAGDPLGATLDRVHYDGGEGRWLSGRMDYTHWMPRPAPPAEEA